MNLGKIMRLGKAAPRCPLCHKQMIQRYDEVKHMFVYTCHDDRVDIAVDDPFVGRWEEALQRAGKIECPNCNADMRYFATSTGFMKAKCVKKGCGATLSNMEPDRTENRIASPDKPGTVQ